MGLFASFGRTGIGTLKKTVSVHRIVILGGGFGGLLTALELERRCGRIGACQIILVDRSSEHVYTPLLYEVASGFLQEPGRICRGELKGGVCVSFEQYREIIGSRHVQFVRDEVVGLERSRKQVLLKQHEPITYDDLVIALGSETNDYGIAGLAQYGFPLKSLHEAYKLRGRLHLFLERYRDGVEEKVTIVVGGAGATGVELAGELGNFFQKLTQEQVIKEGAWSIRLVETGPQILAAFNPRVRSIAHARLRKLGVEVMVNTKIDSILEGAIVLSMDGRTSKTEADIVVWCGGVRPSSMLAKFGFLLGPKGHLDVDEYLRVKGEEEIFALGDATAIAPPLAQAAIAQAGALAENLVRHREGRTLRSWKSQKSWPAIIPVGGRFAIMEIGGFVLQGRLGYWARKMADARYLFRILPFKEAWHVWSQGARTYLKND